MIKHVLNKILPSEIMSSINMLRTDKLYELRLRSGRAVCVNYGGSYRYLSHNGATELSSAALRISEEDVRQILVHACEKSMYALNDKICCGYITLSGGIRMGIVGETVIENGAIKTVKNFSSLNIRFPHEVIGCADKVLCDLGSPSGYYSTLIISPPGAGKTTLLRDISRAISEARRIYNIMIVDERDEIAAMHNGQPTLRVGENTDIISGCTKEYAFSRAVRVMRPDIIITDELCGDRDTAAVENAIEGGVCVFASAHADSYEKIAEKKSFESLMKNKCFKRYVVMSETRGVGTVEGVYDENFRAVGMRVSV